MLSVDTEELYCVSMFYCTLNNNTFKLFFNRAHVSEVNLTISFVSHFK